MTRDAEHTPSPQSVVPTNAQIDSAIKATEYKYFGDYEMSPEQFAAVDTLVAAAAELTRLREAAPAPSSLPGGEVQTLRTLLDNLVIAQSLSKEIRTHATDEARTYLYDTRLAALSPEAPAREGVTHPDAQPFERFPQLALHIERMAMTGLIGSLISWGAFLRELNAAIAQDQSPPITLRDAADELANRFAWSAVTADCDEARQNLQRLIDSVRAALTPRHEAPADKDPVPSEWTGQGADDDFFKPAKTAFSKEAPAEGAGEAMDAGFEAWLNERNLLPHGAWDWPSIVAMLNHHEDALRARSSAPEAREGEEVGWKYEVFGPEGRSRSVRGVIGPKPNVAAPVGGYVLYDALYTHPAAPSGDKLRIAVEAWAELAKRPSWEISFSGFDEEDGWSVHRVTGGVNDREWEELSRADTPLEAIEAALEAEGAKP